MGKKKNCIICIDPNDVNKAGPRETFYCRTPDDIYDKLSPAACFTLVEIKKGYWQVYLNGTSFYLTAFNTPFGGYRLTHLPFGITV